VNILCRGFRPHSSTFASNGLESRLDASHGASAATMLTLQEEQTDFSL